jgi:mannose-6-phosphate isomerase-like protein (cupin superfamily)
MAEKKTAETKYGKYILREPVKEPAVRKRTINPGVAIKAELWPEVSGINCNFAFMCVSEAYLMSDPPHKHDCDEFLYFLAGDPMNMKDFGAEVEIALGEDWEKHVITTTAVVYIPAGLQHCPINVKRVDKPFFFGHIMPSATYAKI